MHDVDKRTSMKYKVTMLLLVVALFIVIVFAIGVGSVKIPAGDVMRSLVGNTNNEIFASIVVNMRLPRVVLAVLVGMALSAAGAVLQAVMKNPLADPGIIGISSGASCAAITIMLLFPMLTPFVPTFAFLGAAIACVLVYLLAWKQGLSPIRIVLAGVAVNSVFGAVITILSILNSDKIQGILLWTSGSLAGKSWSTTWVLIPYIFIGLILAVFSIRTCNLLQLGDETAVSLGVNLTRARLFLSVTGAFLAGITVSFVGIIGFVGLVVPHIGRLIVGSDYKRLLPFSILFGGVIVLLADTLARTIVAPIELPVGAIMAIAGGPFFLYLLRKSKG